MQFVQYQVGEKISTVSDTDGDQMSSDPLVFRSGALPFSHLRLEYYQKERQRWSPTSWRCLGWQSFAEGRNGGLSSPLSSKWAGCYHRRGMRVRDTPGGSIRPKGRTNCHIDPPTQSGICASGAPHPFCASTKSSSHPCIGSTQSHRRTLV